ncbi:YqgE/AlgH family protein [Holosporaceae bacterium 'Namur']|nr:YqgE/AlgH family protein [Holosporaceae bacterium 'Namur']
MGLSMELEFSDDELRPFESLEGKLLVASKSLDGSCFERSLIYICAHDDKGALGIIINNKIGNFYIKDYVGNAYVKPALKNKKVSIMFGGPIDQDRLIILSITKEQEKNFEYFPAVTIYTECKQFLQDYASGNNKDKFLLAKGFAAWEPNQLEQEIEENSWLIAPANLDILFSQKVKNKWLKMVESLGVKSFLQLVNYTGNA